MARVRNPTVRGVLPGGKETGEREALEADFSFFSGVHYTRVAFLSRFSPRGWIIRNPRIYGVSTIRGSLYLVENAGRLGRAPICYERGQDRTEGLRSGRMRVGRGVHYTRVAFLSRSSSLHEGIEPLLIRKPIRNE